jgi:flagellar biosynthesis/type III secretory pathway chaperone
MRFTVVDARGTVSFVAHTSAAVALTASCAKNPTTLSELLDASRQYDKQLHQIVSHGLAIFDEHNMPGDTRAIHEQLEQLPGRESPVFRVLDETTREASLRPVRAGIILFNLLRKRIVQIMNTDEDIRRSGEVNYHNGKFLSRRVFTYELPAEWMIVP